MKVQGEPIEQLGMARRRAHDPEIIRRRDDASAEDLLPETIHGDARGERIRRIDEPLGEPEAIRRSPRREIVEHLGWSCRDLLADLIVGPTHEDVRHGRRVFFLLLDVRDRAAALDRIALALEFRDSAIQILPSRVAGGEVVGERLSICCGLRFAPGGERGMERRDLLETLGFGRAETLREDAQVLHLTFLKDHARTALTETQRRIAARLRVGLELVGEHSRRVPPCRSRRISRPPPCHCRRRSRRHATTARGSERDVACRL
jgi:hypothetical protein